MLFNFYCNKGLLVCCLLLLLTLPIEVSFAQGTGTVRGTVVDAATGEGLTGANVIVQNTSLGAAADLDGNFIIRGVPAGAQKLVISYIGYLPQTVDIQVRAGETVTRQYELTARVLEGEEVVITGQAQGQLSAINQQLSSNTIANVVAQDRIRELPDVNAAESIGRLPGVSIQRSNGEATKVEIRGLSPKYNTVTVNGVRVPATGGDDRSVDLSLISSNMLDGITVKKANTPDMDADALGGTIDLRLREAPEGLHINGQAQGGYNQIQKYYGNYSFNGSVSNRFFANNLGIIASFNVDDYDRSADKVEGAYNITNPIGSATVVTPQELRLRDESVNRGRAGASILLDYRIPAGKITANSFYNRLHWDQTFRINRMDVIHNSHYYDLEDRSGSTDIFTGAIGIEQDYDWIKFDVGASRTSTYTDRPRDLTLGFAQENGAFTPGINENTYPYQIPQHQVIDSNSTGLMRMYLYSYNLKENETAFQFNMQFPMQFGDQISGYIKAGGKFRWLDRRNNEEQNGRDGLQYGSTSGVNNILTPTLKYLSQNNSESWNWLNDSTIVRQNGVFPITRVLENYERSDFMQGEYPFGFVINKNLMNQMADALVASGQSINYSVGSLGRDYDGVERYQAGYLMGEFNWGMFTVIPGVRYERDYSKYNGERYREVSLNNVQGPPADLAYITNERQNEFYLPMFHLIVSPYDWLRVRLASTQTLTRPDYIMYAPITSINSYQNYIRAANSQLKPSHAYNYDVSVSVYENYIGFFTASGFYKEIKDLIFQSTVYMKPGIPVLPGLNIPANWLQGTAPQMDTYVNNPYMAYYRGFELDWQTHFWYLPSVLNGIILNVNYTRIFSSVDKQLFITRDGDIIPGTRPPRRQQILVDTLRNERMPDQPAHILNLTFGYDYKGFSARISYLFQTDKTTFLAQSEAADQYTYDYSRWDLSLQQKLEWGIQLYANFSNLNGKRDISFIGSRSYELNPTNIQRYGFTMDIGARFNL